MGQVFGASLFIAREFSTPELPYKMGWHDSQSLRGWNYSAELERVSLEVIMKRADNDIKFSTL